MRLKRLGYSGLGGLVMAALGLGMAVANPPLPKAVMLRGESIRLEGPDGYCPDPATLRQKDGAAVVLLGRCEEGSLQPPAVITVTLGPAGSAALMMAEGSDMATFLASEAGRKSLSSRGKAADVEVTAALSVGPLFLFRVRDREEGSYWRGMGSLQGRTISVKASGPELAEADSRRLVEMALNALKKANPAP